MRTLALAAAQIFDKLSELVFGPVQGTITTALAAGSLVVPQGQMATLPGGRRVRVLRATRVTTAATAIPVRLEHLADSYPAKANFIATPIGTVATWVSPPAGLPATGTTSALGMNARATNLKIAGVAYYTHVDTPAELFAAGVAGSGRLILLAPTVREVSTNANEIVGDAGMFDATWRLRWVPTNVGEQGPVLQLSSDIYDSLCGALLGANVCEQPVRFRQWAPMTQPAWKGSWELTLVAQLGIEGRVLCHAGDDDDLEGIDAIVEVPDDATQPGPFRVLETIDL